MSLAESFPLSKVYKKTVNDKYPDHPNELFINEEFYSIQGEGLHTGIPMYFVRLQGCTVGCYFCDTKYTWREDKTKKKSISDILERIIDSGTRWVCITGGEPYEQDFYRLVDACDYYGIKTHIETSGTEFFNVAAQWITLSPKDLFAKNNKKTLEVFKRIAHEIKVVVTKEDDIEYYVLNYYEFCGKNKPLIFQAVDNKSELVKPILKYIQDYRLDNARVMLQQHKVIQLR